MPRNWTTWAKWINFLEIHSLQKLNQEQAEKLNRLVTSKMKEVIKTLPAHKRPRPGGFTGEFYQTFKEN